MTTLARNTNTRCNLIMYLHTRREQSLLSLLCEKHPTDFNLSREEFKFRVSVQDSDNRVNARSIPLTGRTILLLTPQVTVLIIPTKLGNVRLPLVFFCII